MLDRGRRAHSALDQTCRNLPPSRVGICQQPPRRSRVVERYRNVAGDREREQEVRRLPGRARRTKTPVLLLEGPRGVGKSTLLAGFANSGVPVVDLDRDDYFQLAQNSPSAVIGEVPPILIDEYQRVPALLDAIKSRLNRETRPGMFVLAGSASYDSLPVGTQALTSRLQRLPILPFTQTEIDATDSHFIERAFEGDVDHTARLATTSRSEYIDRVMRGGMPLALEQPAETDRCSTSPRSLVTWLRRGTRPLHTSNCSRRCSSSRGSPLGARPRFPGVSRRPRSTWSTPV